MMDSTDNMESPESSYSSVSNLQLSQSNTTQTDEIRPSNKSNTQSYNSIQKVFRNESQSFEYWKTPHDLGTEETSLPSDINSLTNSMLYSITNSIETQENFRNGSISTNNNAPASNTQSLPVPHSLGIEAYSLPFEFSSNYRQLSTIIFIEFHNLLGLQIVFHTEAHPGLQVPFKTLEETYSLYLIPKPDLSNQIISFIVGENEWLFVGCPQFMEDLKYERNALVWNLVFGFYLGSKNALMGSSVDLTEAWLDDVTELNPNASTIPGVHQKYLLNDGGMRIVELFTPVIRKVSHSLRQMEIECHLISNHKSEMERVLPSLLHQLNTVGEFSVTFQLEDESSYQLNGKLTFNSSSKHPQDVKPWFVPVPKEDIENLVGPDWDLTVQKIIPYIDATRYVKEISRCCNIHINLVQKAMKHLAYYDAITYIDIFQYSNVYAIHSKQKMMELFHNREMQEECISYVSLNSSNPVQINDLLSLFSKFSVGRNLKNVLSQCDISNIINHKALITYGLLRKILVRVHEYPTLKEGFDSSLYKDYERNGISLFSIFPYLDGKHCLDEICVEFEISRNQLLELLSILEDEFWIIKRKYIPSDM